MGVLSFLWPTTTPSSPLPPPTSTTDSSNAGAAPPKRSVWTFLTSSSSKSKLKSAPIEDPVSALSSSSAASSLAGVGVGDRRGAWFASARSRLHARVQRGSEGLVHHLLRMRRFDEFPLPRVDEAALAREKLRMRAYFRALLLRRPRLGLVSGLPVFASRPFCFSAPVFMLLPYSTCDATMMNIDDGPRWDELPPSPFARWVRRLSAGMRPAWDGGGDFGDGGDLGHVEDLESAAAEEEKRSLRLKAEQFLNRLSLIKYYQRRRVSAAMERFSESNLDALDAWVPTTMNIPMDLTATAAELDPASPRNQSGPEEFVTRPAYHGCTTLATDALRSLVVASVSSVSKLILTRLNEFTVHHLDRLTDVLDEDRSVITVSNHTTAIDDPSVICATVPARYLNDTRRLRWSLCAEERCFKFGAVLSAFFTLGKVLPVRRGDGLDQDSMQVLVKKLDERSWVHVFPEGTRSRSGLLADRMKSGVGKLVLEPSTTPVVVPLYHHNVGAVMKRGRFFPQTGQQIHVYVGEPIDFTDLLEFHRKCGSDRHVIYKDIANFIGNELKKLEDIALAEDAARQQQQQIQQIPQEKSIE